MGATSMINKDIQKTLEKKILNLQEYLKDLEEYAILSDEQILGNKDKFYSLQRVFQLVVDEAVDINAILVYQLGGNIPDSFKSSFYELVPLKIIENSFAERISDSAKIRNQITHDYERLTNVEIVASIKKFFELYKEYVKILIGKFVVDREK